MYSVALDKMLALFSLVAGVKPSNFDKSIWPLPADVESGFKVGTAFLSSAILMFMFVRYFFSTTLWENLSLFGFLTPDPV